MNVKTSVPLRNIQNNFRKITIEAETRSGSELKYVCRVPCVLHRYISVTFVVQGEKGSY